MEAIREDLLSDLLVTTTGTFPPKIIPAAQAPIKWIIIFTNELPASRFGTIIMSALPATLFFIPFIFAASGETALSNARGPATSASIFSFFALGFDIFSISWNEL